MLLSDAPLALPHRRPDANECGRLCVGVNFVYEELSTFDERRQIVDAENAGARFPSA